MHISFVRLDHKGAKMCLKTYKLVALSVQNAGDEITTKDGIGPQIDLVLHIMETNTTDTLRHDKLTKFLNTR